MSTRKPVFFIALNGAILLLVFMFLMQSLVIIRMLGTIDHIEGSVQVKHSDGVWKSARHHDIVHARDMVRTGPGSSAELRWQDGSRVRMGPDTTLTIKKFVKNIVSRNQESFFNLTIGKIWIRIIRAFQPRSRFEIETPTAVAMAMGTIFSVEALNGRTEVSVYEGKVRVRDGKSDEHELASGRAVDVSRDGFLPDVSHFRLNDWKNQERIVGPGLIVEEPSQPQLVVHAPAIRLQGYVEPGSVLSINGTPVHYLRTGEFTHRVKLETGSNTITIVATDKQNRTTTVIRQIASVSRSSGFQDQQPLQDLPGQSSSRTSL